MTVSGVNHPAILPEKWKCHSSPLPQNAIVANYGIATYLINWGLIIEIN
jgi:hypothetical protein